MRSRRLRVERISACHHHHHYSFRSTFAIPNTHRTPFVNMLPDFHHRQHQYQQASNICGPKPSFYLWNGEITNTKKKTRETKNRTGGRRILGKCLHTISSMTQCPWTRAFRTFTRFHHFSRVSFLILIFVRLAALSAVKCVPFSSPPHCWLLAFPATIFPFSSAQSCLTRVAQETQKGDWLVFNLLNNVAALLVSCTA